MCMYGVTGKEESKEKPDPEGLSWEVLCLAF